MITTLAWLRWRVGWECRLWRLAASHRRVDDPLVQSHFDEYMDDWKRRRGY